MYTNKIEVPKEVLPDNLLLCGFRGSIAHGTYIASDEGGGIDDIDILGCYLAPVEYYLGLGNGKVYRKAFEKFVGPWDSVHYEIRKFVRLLMGCNPNVMSLLWLDQQHYLTITEAGSLLIDNRRLFLSKSAYDSFTGYAYSQLKRMTRHEHKGYMGEKRKALVEKFGYDTKNASHLIRLLKMGAEILLDEVVNVNRWNDATELIAIKEGRWTLDEVKEIAETRFEIVRNAVKKSRLPDKPDTQKIEKVLMSILWSYVAKEMRSRDINEALETLKNMEKEEQWKRRKDEKD